MYKRQALPNGILDGAIAMPDGQTAGVVEGGGRYVLDKGGLTIKRNDLRNLWGSLGDVMLILGRFAVSPAPTAPAAAAEVAAASGDGGGAAATVTTAVEEEESIEGDEGSGGDPALEALAAARRALDEREAALKEREAALRKAEEGGGGPVA